MHCDCTEPEELTDEQRQERAEAEAAVARAQGHDRLADTILSEVTPTG